MCAGWREYTAEPDQPVINPNVFATGCHEHANEYWVYMVDARQFMSVLNNEPRFLSITPDTGLIDLKAKETDDAVRDFMTHQIMLLDKSDLDHVAIPLVTAVWFNSESHVPSPPIRVHDDGTEIYNFPDSLALWAGVSDADRTAVMDEKKRKRCQDSNDEEDCPSSSPSVIEVEQQSSSCSCRPSQQALEAEQRYWDGIRVAVRAAERKRPAHGKTSSESESELEQQYYNGYRPQFKCKKMARFGAGQNTARINQAKTALEIQQDLQEIGLEVDFAAREIYPTSPLTVGS
jgi:hypothetical protein